MSKKIILITGASSGFGRPTAEAIARAGHTVYASMRDITGRNAKNAAEMAGIEGIDIRPIEFDVQSDVSPRQRSPRSSPGAGGSTCWSTTEAFTPEGATPFRP